MFLFHSLRFSTPTSVQQTDIRWEIRLLVSSLRTGIADALLSPTESCISFFGMYSEWVLFSELCSVHFSTNPT